MTEINPGDPSLIGQVAPQVYQFKVQERGRYRLWVSDKDATISLAPGSDPDNPVLIGKPAVEGVLVKHDYVVKVKTKKGRIYDLHTRKLD
jgi:ribosomal protein L21